MLMVALEQRGSSLNQADMKLEERRPHPGDSGFGLLQTDECPGVLARFHERLGEADVTGRLVTPDTGCKRVVERALAMAERSSTPVAAQCRLPRPFVMVETDVEIPRSVESRRCVVESRFRGFWIAGVQDR
jgi:hypothetical protein